MTDIKYFSTREKIRNGLYRSLAGTLYYYTDDLIHRENGPAIIFPNGTKSWFNRGKRIGKCVGQPHERWFIFIDAKEIEVDSEEKFQKKIKLLMIFQ